MKDKLIHDYFGVDVKEYYNNSISTKLAY